MTAMRRIRMLRRATATLALMATAAGGGPALAQPREAPYAARPTVQARDGEGVYRSMCQGCHMPDGRGAAGAAAYPALANNPKLQTAGYPLTLVLKGQRAMPAVGAFLDDAQVAAVVTFIRTHFGNDYREPVTAADVRALR
jgi:mono/diheme cytochrome c family protein